MGWDAVSPAPARGCRWPFPIGRCGRRGSLRLDSLRGGLGASGIRQHLNRAESRIAHSPERRPAPPGSTPAAASLCSAGGGWGGLEGGRGKLLAPSTAITRSTTKTPTPKPAAAGRRGGWCPLFGPSDQRRYRPVRLSGQAAILSGVPDATIRPPASPPPGPMSMR